MIFAILNLKLQNLTFHISELTRSSGYPLFMNHDFLFMIFEILWTT